MTDTTPDTFICPRCHWVSHNPHDVEHGYCGHCRDWTGQLSTPNPCHCEGPSHRNDCPEWVMPV